MTRSPAWRGLFAGRRRTAQSALLGAALCTSLAASAGPIPFNTFMQFGFEVAGQAVTGCAPDDPNGPFCIPSSGTPTTFLDAPAWTFLAPISGAVLTVVDAFTAGDRFDIFDFGNLIGSTSAAITRPPADCGDDPAVCLATVGMDVGIFNLAAGAHALTLVASQTGGLGSGYLRVAAVVGVLPEPGSIIGTFDAAPGSLVPITGRMSNKGWGSRAGCHAPSGWSDNVVWIFGGGPRRTIPQHTDFDQTVADRSSMRVLNWSAERDEQEDFELNIRGVSGGAGLIVLADGLTPDPAVVNFTPLASGGRNQLTVRGVPAWDAIKAFQQFGIRAPISPLKATEPDVIAGRALFAAANCQSCHNGAQWTNSGVNFAPPPGAGVTIVGGQIVDQLRAVGSFDPSFFNEVRANAGAPLGALGFVPASLLSLHAFPRSFFHNGAVDSLDKVMDNVTHRSGGTSGVDTLTSAADRARLVKFLLSIDGSTVPFAR